MKKSELIKAIEDVLDDAKVTPYLAVEALLSMVSYYRRQGIESVNLINNFVNECRKGTEGNGSKPC